MVKINSPFQSN